MTDTQTHDHNHEENYITIIDEEGGEQLYEILFTFESQDFNKEYVLVFPVSPEREDEDDEEEDIELLAFSYTEDADGESGQLHNIETDEEWDMIEEVLNTFLLEDEE